MQANKLNLDDFPGSAYAEELRRGLAYMRFDAPLEAEYTEVHLKHACLRVRVWFSMVLVLAILYAVDQLRRAGNWDAVALVLLGLLIPCTGALVWLSLSRYYERFYLPASKVVVTLFGVLTAVSIAYALTISQDELLAVLTVHLLAVFFFTGLMFRQAVYTSAVMIVAFAIAAVAMNVSQAIFLKSMVIMVLTSCIAATVYRDVEQSYRKSFLESALINELVARDPLSGLKNRRAFDEHLLRIWQQALRDRRSIAVLMIDIDFFKRFNDEFGHQAGDLALRSVANILRGYARRPLDLAARYGGEEFALILYDLAFEHVQDIAERLREAVGNLKIKPQQAASGPELTVSVGVGIAVPTIGRTPEGAVQLADEALYEAKQAGRNRVVAKGAEAYSLLDTGAFQTYRRSLLR